MTRRCALALVLLASAALAKPPKGGKGGKKPPPVTTPAPAPEPVPEPAPAPAATPASEKPATPRIALPLPSGGPGVSPEVLSLAEQTFERELRALTGVTVVTASELKTLLGVERQRELLGAGSAALNELATQSVTDVVVVQLTAKGADEVDAVVKRTSTAGAQVKSFTRSTSTRGTALLSLAMTAVADLFPEFPRSASATTAASTPAKKLLRVAVLDPRLTGDIPARAAAALNQALAPELRKLEGVIAISSAEVRDILGIERQRQLVGCSEGTSCMEELANALGAEELVTVDLTLVGHTYALTARRVDTVNARVLQNHLAQFDKRDGEELLAVVGTLLEKLYPERPLRAGTVRGVEPAVIRRLNPPPLPKWVFITTAALAVASAGGGTTFTLLGADSRAKFDTLARGSLPPAMAVEGSTLVELEKDARERNTIGLGFFIAAGGLAAVALVEAFFTDWNDDRAAAGLAVLPVLSPGHAGLLVRF